MEYRYSNTSQPQGRAANFRHSITSRFSRLLERRNDQSSSMSQSHRTSGACEVPIFMSPSSDRLHIHPDNPEATAAISPAWRQSAEHVRPLTVPASSVYSQSPDVRVHRSMDQIEEDPSPQSSETAHDLEAGLSSVSYTTSEDQLVRRKSRKRRRIAESYRERIAAKKRLGVAFGVTTLAAVITYVVLAVTGAAKGVMFHVVSLVFILILMGVFLHSAIRMVMLQRRRRARQARQREWHGSRSGSDSVSSSRSRSENSINPFADPISEKPIPVVVGGDEVVTTTPRGKNKKVIRPPPPMYGSFRESKRIRPELLFWHKQNPSPSTPTYEEALDDVHTAVGYLPPEYVSPKRHRAVVNAGQRMSDIHPLERGRLAGLLGNTMSSQRQRVPS